MNISDIATSEFIEVSSDTRLGKVKSIFERENPKGIIVTNNGEYEGVVTERQLLQSHIGDDTKVRKLTQAAPKVDRTEDVRRTARMLIEGNTKVAPVFEAGRLWGIVTVDAILEAVIESLSAITVGDIATGEVKTIDEETTIGQAINQLREHGISRLPVVNENGYLTGMVTTHDIVDFVTRDMDTTRVGERSGEMDRMLDLPVYDVMSNPVSTITASETAQTAVERMLEHDFAGLVVTPEDDDRLVAGILTKTDVLRALSFTETDHMDVQITNIDLLETLTREQVREAITEVADKYQDMQVRHAHVRFHEHKERLRGTPLVMSQIRLRTNRGQMAGTGEGYGADNAFHVAIDTLERNVLETKGVRQDERYRGQLLRKLGEL